MNVSLFLFILYVALSHADLDTIIALPRLQADGLSPDVKNVMRAGFTTQNDDVVQEKLYTSIVIGEYESALVYTILMHNNLKGHIISQVIARLLRDRKANAMEYAYTLWKYSQPIAEHYFPVQFKWIFNENYVELINRKPGIRLELKVSDVNMIGKVRTWELIPVWEMNRLSFKVLNVGTNQYLTLNAVDHLAYTAADDQTSKFLWYLQPVIFENDLLFFIYNRELNLALEYVDLDGDGLMEVRGSNKNVHGTPDVYGWFIMPL